MAMYLTTWLQLYTPSAELGQSTTTVDSATVHGQYKLHTKSCSELQPSPINKVNA